ncbi:2Fe-2S iron-sulfur cluster binding domain-containing protein [Modestobacter sp. I12A-02628]|uniref:(2Fe-2S)-binding protein n=1 Tax=Goekera deserti TaxID=2497753 RepID=A0A7K3WHZ0_9ACTN|nr:(2Fe-2S)-binding protein [Goekera deserti]MPQ97740.1 2Fe-2S iron-sulfur cluster binding domain-containing protein [Goekera deserti]NDI48385.1 2Fe-2S iron-sulfur cluster binding domain-containing protein [Goekera deserti]NEL55986.1 (2Fe-2S)-binding protein [Goekera deserti]
MSSEADESVTFSLTVDGAAHEVTAPWSESLLTVLRERLGVRGPKTGCAHGRCGACAVRVAFEPDRADDDGHVLCSCLLPAATAAGCSVRTIASIGGPDGELSDVQEAFLAEGAVQCGICTAGFVTAATELLDTDPDPTREQIEAALYGNLCRCTGYGRIVAAVETAARTRREATP